MEGRWPGVRRLDRQALYVARGRTGPVSSCPDERSQPPLSPGPDRVPDRSGWRRLRRRERSEERRELPALRLRVPARAAAQRTAGLPGDRLGVQYLWRGPDGRRNQRVRRSPPRPGISRDGDPGRVPNPPRDEVGRAKLAPPHAIDGDPRLCWTAGAAARHGRARGDSERLPRPTGARSGGASFDGRRFVRRGGCGVGIGAGGQDGAIRPQSGDARQRARTDARRPARGAEAGRWSALSGRRGAHRGPRGGHRAGDRGAAERGARLGARLRAAGRPRAERAQRRCPGQAELGDGSRRSIAVF